MKHSYFIHPNAGWIKVEVLQTEKEKAKIRILDDKHDKEQQNEQKDEIQWVELDSLVTLVEDEKIDGVEDMMNMTSLTEPSILFNLRKRFLSQHPYTGVGEILLAVNPFEWFHDLYTPIIQHAYSNFNSNEHLPPHIYQSSCSSYHHLQRYCVNQTILVSGESGSGKTETTKLLLSHLTYLGGKKNDKEQVLYGNILIENFGNAQTSRNDNSSRFGKFSELKFNHNGKFLGSKAFTYLFEKSRVTHLNPGDRNFHIFYQLCSSNESIKNNLGLMNIENFSILLSSCSSHKISFLPSEIDGSDFNKTIEEFNILNIPTSTQLNIFQVLASILHLSAIDFEKDNDICRISSTSKTYFHLDILSKLLNVDEKVLQKKLSTRWVYAYKESFEISLNVSQAHDHRNVLCRELYSSLFFYIVHLINTNTQSIAYSKSDPTISILDIFGFEIFDINSLEQLCINYANEKLQEKFLFDMFKSIENEFVQEDIKIDWKPRENNNILDGFENRFGIFSLLNEENLRPKGNAKSFWCKLQMHQQENTMFEFPKISSLQFKIFHYADTVNYSVDDMLIKNQLTIPKHVFEFLDVCDNKFISLLFEQQHQHQKQSNKFTSVGNEFQYQLKNLMKTIGKTQTHYIKCIKPNDIFSPVHFEKKKVLHQLKCAGICQALKSNRKSFLFRFKKELFFQRFFFLKPDKLNEFQSKNNFLIGKTKIFLTKENLEDLEMELMEKQNYFACRIQNFFKCQIEKRKYLLEKLSIIIIQKHIRMFLARRNYHYLLKNIVIIQSCIRMHQDKMRFYIFRRWKACVYIQSWLKMRREYLRFQKKKTCILKIQSIIRCFMGKKQVSYDRQQLTNEYKIQQLQLKLRCRSTEVSDIIDSLQKDKKSLMDHNKYLVQENKSLKKELENLEVGALSKDLTSKEANQKVETLTKEVNLLREAQSKIKVVHRILRDQNLEYRKQIQQMMEEIKILKVSQQRPPEQHSSSLANRIIKQRNKKQGRSKAI